MSLDFRTAAPARIKLGVEQVDLLLLHQALPSQFEKTLKACLALGTLPADGTLRAIGILKSTRPERISENIDVFEVKLTDDEQAAIDGLDTGQALPSGGAGARDRRIRRTLHGRP
jgi:diketogulonate reductase-like aldo/keto reductase